MKIRAFAYLDINHPLVAWETAIGRLRSANPTKKESFHVSMWMYSRLRRLATSGEKGPIDSELRLEEIRLTEFPEKVSRLQGIYLFESLEDCKNAIPRWGIKCSPDYISEIEFDAMNVTRLDSEWITHYSNSKEKNWMSSYWSGETVGERPLTELIAHGTGIILNRDLRVKAYAKILSKYPESTYLLASATCGYQYESLDELAVMIPAIVAEGTRLKGGFLLDMRQFDREQKAIIRSVETAKRMGTFPPVIQPEEEGAFFRTPDMTDLFFYFGGPSQVEKFAKIHEA